MGVAGGGEALLLVKITHIAFRGSHWPLTPYPYIVGTERCTYQVFAGPGCIFEGLEPGWGGGGRGGDTNDIGYLGVLLSVVACYLGPRFQEQPTPPSPSSEKKKGDTQHCLRCRFLFVCWRQGSVPWQDRGASVGG